MHFWRSVVQALQDAVLLPDVLSPGLSADTSHSLDPQHHKASYVLQLNKLDTTKNVSISSTGFWHTGEEGIVMSELGKHLQFPTRTFHKPNHLKDFTARLGLYACKEQRGKAVVVCLHAPQQLLDEYRQQHPPAGAWLQHGWVSAVHDAIGAGLPADLDPADSTLPIIAAMPAEEAVQAPQQKSDTAASEQRAQQASPVVSPPHHYATSHTVMLTQM